MAPRPWRVLAHEARAILRLGGPLLIANLSLAGMPLADTVMAGRLGPTVLGAVAVGSSFYSLALYFGLGVMTALSALTAHAYGSGFSFEVGRYARQSPWVAVLLGAVLFVLLLPARQILQSIGTDPSVVSVAADYVLAVAWGLPAVLLAHGLRCSSEGLGRTFPVMVVTAVGLCANVFLNWILIYGRLGSPPLGAVGAGYATALSQWVMAALYVGWFARAHDYRPYGIVLMPRAPDLKILKEMLALGIPMGGAMLAETALFSAAGLMVGTLGAATVAAHQIALNYASFTFMAPVSLHSATTIQVGHALGGRDRHAARLAGYAGILLCGVLMAASAAALLVFRGEIAALYTSDLSVQAQASGLLLLAGLFQLSDGVQVGAMGALRGFKDARVPLAITLTAYWGAGFPVAYHYGLAAGHGPSGVWWGLIAGLTMAALLLVLRYRFVSGPTEP